MSKLFNNQSKNFKNHDWLKVLKQKKTECKLHKKLLIVVKVEQHIKLKACVQNAFVRL